MDGRFDVSSGFELMSVMPACKSHLVAYISIGPRPQQDLVMQLAAQLAAQLVVQLAAQLCSTLYD